MYVVDTGPVLKFFATNTERWFFAALANNPVHAPEAVRREVFDVPRRYRQFERAPTVWAKVEGRLVKVLSDSPTPELEEVAKSVFQEKLATVQARSKDLGERMALLHASVRAQSGDDVLLLCDDGGAQELIRREGRRLKRLGAPGELAVADSLQILAWAIERGVVPTPSDLRKAYSRMAALDESLPRQIRHTPLLDSPPWPSATARS